MDWIDRLNEAVSYIENHLGDEIDYERLGKIAGCSAYHFQRMFAFLAGVPLSEYIRRRRMSLAVADLRGGGKIVDISLKYGYSSPTAFNRAFQSVHKIAPSMVKGGGVTVKSFPPLNFKMTVKGVEEMNYRIETREAFRIVGISMPLQREIEKNFLEVPRMWQRAQSDGTVQKLAELMEGSPEGILGVCVCNDREPWRYLIAAASGKSTEEFEEYTVPGTDWAIFSGSGTGRSIQELEQRIYTEWLPTSGYDYGDGADLEVYLDADPEQTRYEVWVPVKKKRK